MMRLLFVSNLFPDTDHPIRGLDNATLLHAMAEDFSIRVLSPRAVLPPWRRIGTKARAEDLPFSPRYVACPYVPKFGSFCNDWLMARSLRAEFARIVREFRPDAVLCSWLYPDACAVARLAKFHQVPLVLITQGTDTHGYLGIPARRRKIIRAIGNSAAVVCRSANLGKRLEEAGAERKKLHAIYNGVDTEVFRPRDRGAIRHELGIAENHPLLLFVGNYLPVKNPLFLIEAHAHLNRRRAQAGKPLARLVMVGDGPLREDMEKAVRDHGTVASVEILNRETPASIARRMNAADLLCMSSHNEGFPNVILEAMACGLRVVSTDVGGIHELVCDPSRGLLVQTGDLGAYVSALEQALAFADPRQSEVETRPACDWSWKRAADHYKAVILAAIRSTGS
jgi:teichuronic acid biosynthesis glycosyltransferase TuaC